MKRAALISAIGIIFSAAPALADDGFTFAVGSKGLSITSADNQYALKLRGYVQVDNRSFLGNHGKGDLTCIRSARPIAEAKITDYFDARFMMDFGRGQNQQILDAYTNFHPLPGDASINLRAGEFKSPVGLERWQSEQDLLFAERGQTTNLVPSRDIGFMAYGQPGGFEYELAVLNGAADRQSNTGGNSAGSDVAARVFAHPLGEEFGIGIGGTYGVHKGNPAGGDLASGYVTFGQSSYFKYSSGTYADGPQWRINPQAMYYNGPIGLLGEVVVNSQKLTKGASIDTLRNTAWEGIATYVLTGEDASFSGVKPAHPFDMKGSGWGAFELAGRVSRLTVDSAAFPAFVSAASSARSALDETVGINWYMNHWVKMNLDYSHTSFDGGAVSGDRRDENVILSRVQFKF